MIKQQFISFTKCGINSGFPKSLIKGRQLNKRLIKIKVKVCFTQGRGVAGVWERNVLFSMLHKLFFQNLHYK